MQQDSKEAGYHGLGYAKDGKVYLKSSLGKPERIIGDVKAGEAEAIDYFVRRFDLIRKKVDTMLEAMDKAENKGSYLMQVLHLKDSLYTFNAIGPFEELKEKLEAAEEQIKHLIENNRVKNLEQKTELLAKAKVEAENPDIRAAIKGLKDIRFSWMTIGSVSKDSEEALETEFQDVLDKFQVLKDKYTEERNIEIEIRRQKLLILLETASKLNTYPPEVEQSFFKMRKLEEEWKAVGNVPKAIYGPLFEQFKRIKKTITKYARKGPQGGGQNRNYGPRPIQMPRFIPEHEQPLYDNLQRRLDLIDEAQSLLKIDLRQANELAKDIQARWKNAGQIPEKFKSEVFNQFNAISDRIFESSYLARVVHTKYPHFRTMAPAEQLEAKIEAMDEIILKEDMTVKITQAEFEFMSIEERQLEENRSRFSRLNTSLRKLKMKHKILQELRRELDRLKNGGNSSYGGYQQRERSPYPPRNNYGGGGGYQDRGGYQNRNSGGGYQDRNSGGGYQDRNSGGGYQDRNSGGGYQDRNSGGGYQDRNSGGGYQDRYSGGGYQDRNSGGGYQDRDRNGYSDRGGYSSDRPSTNRDDGYERRPYGDRPPGSSGYSSDRNRGYEPPPRFTSKPLPERKPDSNESDTSGQ